MNKFDFAHMLSRRRFTVQRWLESEQINTWKSFKGWMKQNDSLWTFSEAFVLEAKGILQAPAAPVVAPKLEEVVAVPFQEFQEPLPPQEPIRVKPKGKSVQNPPQEE